ncbi:endopeptidase La [Gilliamella sp. Pra-s65]|uniref:endopeptidase La n=1 Tax=unclassified Gilliamella TaxID=2685620 RepID=UPI001365664C|nr:MULTISPECIES: endopeptidase La [unclassified Gilliamella]MWN89149.1 endopeptidase La [Gilliamella sp. Pra-s65]MWP47207.1 endopeptidase La [Gilliamella sp. Pas-s27]MWP72192.1 endopeptidase La [Gilliamella sp. Pra-s52]
MNIKRTKHMIMPILPLRDVIVFPHMVIPLFVGRSKSISCLESAMDMNKQVFLVTQRDPSLDDPDIDDLYEVGTVANVLQLLQLPDGTVKVLVEGVQRAKMVDVAVQEKKEFFIAKVKPLSEVKKAEDISEAMIRLTLSNFDEYSRLNKKVTQEVVDTIRLVKEPSRLADSIAATLFLRVEQKQEILVTANLVKRFELLISLMESEIDLLQVEKNIRQRVKQQMEKAQKEYYLNEQIKAIHKELGDIDNKPDEYEELKDKITKAKMPKDAADKALTELNKLKMMPAMSAEATVVRSYIDWMIQVPWYKCSKTKKGIEDAQKVLDKDHYGLERVKDRILEYLAVQGRVNKVKGPILCLVGPPGVGKTSLGQSIAKATGRQYIRMALGGVRDEAEIRGHRRTYIGSMPGKLIQRMAKVGVKNPLFLLDEIDKMSSDMRGDPASALLEVLDPEQNNAFNDHYLEVDYDLSDVMFVATANSMNIPAPLLDRMEVIRLSGYTEDEKLNIAKQHLITKQIENSGLKSKEISIDDSAIIAIIRYYTREAGVRGLEREIAKICRKVVKKLALDSKLKKVIVTQDNLKDFLGIQRFDYGKTDNENRIGQVIGLAWTEVGGDLLTIESVSVLGKGKLTYTGSLGDVMQESIQTALTVVRSCAEKLGIDSDFYEKRDIHVHVPDGATPKDGPSAGIAMCTSLISTLTGNPVRSDVAMTGEITLRGEVLPIGGLKEKLLAAHRGGIKTVLIPMDNVKDLEDIPDNVKSEVDIHPVKWIDEVLSIALQNNPFGIEPMAKKTKLKQPAKKSIKKLKSSVRSTASLN